MAQTVLLKSEASRDLACSLVLRAPADSVCKISAPRRTNDQNALFWSLLSEVSRAKPGGRMHTPEVWKELFMHACGHAVQFEMGLNGQPFPVGFRSSRLSKDQMSDLIEFIFAWGAENQIQFNRDGEPERGAQEDALANNHSPEILQ